MRVSACVHSSMYVRVCARACVRAHARARACQNIDFICNSIQLQTSIQRRMPIFGTENFHKVLLVIYIPNNIITSR